MSMWHYCATLLKSTLLNKVGRCCSEILAKWSQGYMPWLLLKNHVPICTINVCPIWLEKCYAQKCLYQCVSSELCRCHHRHRVKLCIWCQLLPLLFLGILCAPNWQCVSCYGNKPLKSGARELTSVYDGQPAKRTWFVFLHRLMTWK